ncbi:MAG TPA: hypothetical protein VMU94_05250 [Streptosporangiaceae bacterium]|nr:hypothetical protein [Streptosporangiaceae bacterium]
MLVRVALAGQDSATPGTTATARGCQEATGYETFDTILLAIRGSEDPATGMFAALVMSAAPAADGRDAIARAPSLREISEVLPGATGG